jgi:tetratricopeptide (TPR) repeat protein
VCWPVAYTLLHKRRFSDAKDTLEEALAIRQRLHSKPRADIGATLRVLGACSYEMGDYEKAKKLGQQAKDIFLELSGSDENVAECNELLGKCLYMQAHYTAALGMYASKSYNTSTLDTNGTHARTHTHTLSLFRIYWWSLQRCSKRHCEYANNSLDHNICNVQAFSISSASCIARLECTPRVCKWYISCAPKYTIMQAYSNSMSSLLLLLLLLVATLVPRIVEHSKHLAW